eukprot:TRINITY_DN2048_c0_g1_i1.p1 TRINITY_DN2048_c0_g1~~TRINITY_DN2048_c0_g1_i1.p1  ORF type:complete len:441 (-),score=64.68 TRINITY_DN2048_c0_g1_i1:1285-2607(-)
MNRNPRHHAKKSPSGKTETVTVTRKKPTNLLNAGKSEKRVGDIPQTAHLPRYSISDKNRTTKLRSGFMLTRLFLIAFVFFLLVKMSAEEYALKKQRIQMYLKALLNKYKDNHISEGDVHTALVKHFGEAMGRKYFDMLRQTKLKYLQMLEQKNLQSTQQPQQQPQQHQQQQQIQFQQQFIQRQATNAGMQAIGRGMQLAPSTQNTLFNPVAHQIPIATQSTTQTTAPVQPEQEQPRTNFKELTDVTRIAGVDLAEENASFLPDEAERTSPWPKRRYSSKAPAGFLDIRPLKLHIEPIRHKHGLKKVQNKVYAQLSLATQIRMREIIAKLITYSRHRNGGPPQVIPQARSLTPRETQELKRLQKAKEKGTLTDTTRLDELTQLFHNWYTADKQLRNRPYTITVKDLLYLVDADILMRDSKIRHRRSFLLEPPDVNANTSSS